MNAPHSFITTSPLFGDVPMDRIIIGPYQPRQTFDEEELKELAASFANVGLLQPILLRPATGQVDMYELVAGERRYRAAIIAGMTEIPGLVRDLTDIQVATIQLIENIQRKGVNPLEEATAIHRLQTEFGMNVDQICEELSMKRAQVYARLKLLELPETTKEKVKDGTINASTALLIARLPSEEEKTEATTKILEGDGTGSAMSVREAKEYINTNHHQSDADESDTTNSAATDSDRTSEQSQDRDAATSGSIAEFNKTNAKASKPKKLSKAELESIAKQRMAADVAGKESTYYFSIYMAVRAAIVDESALLNEAAVSEVYRLLAPVMTSREYGYDVVKAVAATYPFDFHDTPDVVEFMKTATASQVALLYVDCIVGEATDIQTWMLTDGFFVLEEYQDKQALVTLLELANLYGVDVASLHAAAFPTLEPEAEPEPEKEAPAAKKSKKSPAKPKAKVTAQASDDKPKKKPATPAKSKHKTVANPDAMWPFPVGEDRAAAAAAARSKQTEEGEA